MLKITQIIYRGCLFLYNMNHPLINEPIQFKILIKTDKDAEKEILDSRDKMKSGMPLNCSHVPENQYYVPLGLIVQNNHSFPNLEEEQDEYIKIISDILKKTRKFLTNTNHHHFRSANC